MISMYDYVNKKDFSVLFAEDNEDIRKYMVSALRLLFREVVEAENGEEAWKKYNQGHFDIIITDMSMPHSDGSVLIGNIRNVDKEIPIIIISAHSEFVKIYEEVDNVFVLTKPVTVFDLLYKFESIEKKITNRKLASEAYAKLEKAQEEARKVLDMLKNYEGECKNVDSNN